MPNYSQILSEIIENKRSWKELKVELSDYNVHDKVSGKIDTRAGKIFEIFTKYYFQTSPLEKDNYKNVWLFEELPLDVREKLRLGNVDHGVDLVLEDLDGQYIVVQCKFKNDETSKLNWTADRIANLFGIGGEADGYVVFANVAEIAEVAKNRDKNFTFYSVTNLLEIESEVFKDIHGRLTNNEEVERKLFKPKKHQKAAIKSCVEFFEIEERGQLILPCGAGKTLTALWIKERLDCNSTLVLVPSLALLRQIKNEWAKQRRTAYKYICVCSENDIDKDGVDAVVTHTYEVDINVTTDSKQIHSFLIKDDGEKVIFSTYHSLEAVAEAIKEAAFEFDFIYCDEAHKTAGLGINRNSLVHDNEKIPSKRRLYGTATPRIVKESLKRELGTDFKYAYDMNDPDIFGYEFYRMTFKDAIDRGILVDYQIIAIGVGDEELKEYIRSRHFVDERVSIDEVANNYALEYVMNKYDASHAISFHSRVKWARQFADRHEYLFKNVKAFSVSGDQPSSHRNLVLKSFELLDKAIVSNARCLTEGVDVPAIDLVYFCDPRNSKIDIVQAVGRALRKKDGKEKGYIVIPVYHTKNDDVEKSISDSSFKNLLSVIRSLCEQDERLQEEINSLAFGKGKRNTNRVEIASLNLSNEQGKLMLEGFEEKLRKSLFDQVIDKTSNNWDLRLLELEEWLDLYKKYPSITDNKALYQWVAVQRNRYKKKNINTEELKKLNSINFIWDKQDWKWELMYNLLIEYANENDFEPGEENSPDLSKWYRTQISQINKGSLSEKRTSRIKEVVFIGPSLMNKWVEKFDELVRFRELNPDRWPNDKRLENKPQIEIELGIWLRSRKEDYKHDKLSEYWIDKLLEIGYEFDNQWERNFRKVERFIIDNPGLSSKVLDEKLLLWIERNLKKLNEGTLTQKQSILFKSLHLENYLEEKKTADEIWHDTFKKLAQWKQKNGDFPSRYKDPQLATWLSKQKKLYKNEQLPQEQTNLLTGIGFDFRSQAELENDIWMENFQDYVNFKKQYEREPRKQNESSEFEAKIYDWVQIQKALHAGTMDRRKPLLPERITLLNSIGFEWRDRTNSRTVQWDESLKQFKTYVETSGNTNPPSKIDGERNPLYTWWHNQKALFKKGIMSDEHYQKFKDIGIDLNNLTA